MRFNSLRCLFAVAINRNYDIEHLDVVIAFLNDYLEEEIYMEQPESFVKKGQKNKVCKLMKAFYGLKQGASSWKKLEQSFMK